MSSFWSSWNMTFVTNLSTPHWPRHLGFSIASLGFRELPLTRPLLFHMRRGDFLFSFSTFWPASMGTWNVVCTKSTGSCKLSCPRTAQHVEWVSTLVVRCVGYLFSMSGIYSPHSFMAKTRFFSHSNSVSTNSWKQNCRRNFTARRWKITLKK